MLYNSFFQTHLDKFISVLSYKMKKTSRLLSVIQDTMKLSMVNIVEILTKESLNKFWNISWISLCICIDYDSSFMNVLHSYVPVSVVQSKNAYEWNQPTCCTHSFQFKKMSFLINIQPVTHGPWGKSKSLIDSKLALSYSELSFSCSKLSQKFWLRMNQISWTYVHFKEN